MKRNVPALCPCVCCVGADKAISPELPQSPAKLVETRCTRETITRSAGHRNTHLSYPNNKIPDMRNHRFLSLCASGLAILLSATAAPLPAQEGHWEITQLPIANAYHPSINNTGEIVWFLNSDGGVFSSTRGKLADAGINPHLANSGEVVYAGWFGGPAWDLVSTTRGRLTQGSVIDVNFSDFDVNSQGEAVYVVKDTNNFAQVFSTLRHQITFEAADHYNPCINDLGEIAWNQYQPGVGIVVFSTTRGLPPGLTPDLLDLNNAGEFCFSGNLEGPPGYYSFPHLFSSAHGVLISDPNQFQWYGTINDAGTLVWAAPDQPGSSAWYLYQAKWVVSDTTPPQILSLAATPNLLWPANHRLIPVMLTVNAVDNSDPSPVVRITQVTCNEPRASSTPDWELTGPLSLNLRADRSGNGKGRVYTVMVQCQDASGNVSSASVDVPVPHDKKP